MAGFDLLDFIETCLKELDNDNKTDKDGNPKSFDFKTIAKLTASMKRTNSEKVTNVKNESGGVKKGRVGRTKSLRSKRNRAKKGKINKLIGVFMRCDK